MNKNIMIAYTEVDQILELMDEEFKQKIPQKLRTLIYNNKLHDYNVIINPNIPLKEQNISKKALAILAVLNYNYWSTESEQKKLLEQYNKNEMEKQKALREDYNLDNLFKNKTINNNSENDTKQLIVYKKENLFNKIFNKIKRLLHLT